MNEILMKKKCLHEALRLCEIEILQNLVGKRVKRNVEGVVIEVDINTKYPNESKVTYVTNLGKFKYIDVYRGLRILGD